MKLPALIWRLAVFCWHFGHVSSAGSEIFWISSHWFWQAEQAYSYVGMCDFSAVFHGFSMDACQAPPAA